MHVKSVTSCHSRSPAIPSPWVTMRQMFGRPDGFWYLWWRTQWPCFVVPVALLRVRSDWLVVMVYQIMIEISFHPRNEGLHLMTFSYSAIPIQSTLFILTEQCTHNYNVIRISSFIRTECFFCVIQTPNCLNKCVTRNFRGVKRDILQYQDTCTATIYEMITGAH